MKILFIILLVFTPLIIYAHSGDTINVPQGTSPIIDGEISSGEWDDAAIFTYQAGLPGKIITITFYIKHNGTDTLYVAQNMPNTLSGDRNLVCFDTNNNGGAYPQTDDYMLNKYHMNGSPTVEEKGTGSTWNMVTQNGWIVALTGYDWSSSVGQIEFAVVFSKLGITPGNQKTIGFCIVFGEKKIPYDPSRMWSWPSNSDHFNPNSWADLIFFGTANISEEKLLIEANPFTVRAVNPVGRQPGIYFSTPVEVDVSVDIFDITGRKVVNLFDGRMQGTRTFNFESESTGSYIYRVTAAGRTYSGKVVVVY